MWLWVLWWVLRQFLWGVLRFPDVHCVKYNGVNFTMKYVVNPHKSAEILANCWWDLRLLLFFFGSFFFTKIRQPQIVFSSRFQFIICFSFGSGLFGVCWENYQQNTGNYNVCQPTPPSPLPILWAPGKKIVEIKEKLFTEGAWPSLTLVYRILKIVPIVQG